MIARATKSQQEHLSSLRENAAATRDYSSLGLSVYRSTNIFRISFFQNTKGEVLYYKKKSKYLINKAAFKDTSDSFAYYKYSKQTIDYVFNIIHLDVPNWKQIDKIYDSYLSLLDKNDHETLSNVNNIINSSIAFAKDVSEVHLKTIERISNLRDSLRVYSQSLHDHYLEIYSPTKGKEDKVAQSEGNQETPDAQ